MKSHDKGWIRKYLLSVLVEDLYVITMNVFEFGFKFAEILEKRTGISGVQNTSDTSSVASRLMLYQRCTSTAGAMSAVTQTALIQYR
jgi:hypothetical protein